MKYFKIPKAFILPQEVLILFVTQVSIFIHLIFVKAILILEILLTHLVTNAALQDMLRNSIVSLSTVV